MMHLGFRYFAAVARFGSICQAARAVHVSAIESLVPHLLPEVIARFNRRHPGIQFDIAIEGSDRVLSAVREGRTDIGLTFHPPADPELATAFKLRAPLLAIMSSQHPL